LMLFFFSRASRSTPLFPPSLRHECTPPPLLRAGHRRGPFPFLLVDRSPCPFSFSSSRCRFPFPVPHKNNRDVVLFLVAGPLCSIFFFFFFFFFFPKGSRASPLFIGCSLLSSFCDFPRRTRSARNHPFPRTSSLPLVRRPRNASSAGSFPLPQSSVSFWKCVGRTDPLMGTVERSLLPISR